MNCRFIIPLTGNHFIFARKNTSARYMYMRFLPILLFFTLGIESCSGPESEKTDPEYPAVNIATDEADVNNPIFADSIKPADLKDTALIADEYAKDSLKLSVAFQLAANRLSMAYKNRDAFNYSKYAPPAMIQYYGGIEKYRQRVKQAMDSDPTDFNRIVSGPARRIAAAIDDDGYGHGWYCLMPVRRFRIENGKELMELQWLGGQTLDMGKTIYFLDVTGKPREQILQLMPDLRFVLDKEVE